MCVVKLRLRSGKDALACELAKLRHTQLSFTDPVLFPERTLQTRVTTTPCNLLECDLDWFFRYRIFPPWLLRFCGEWEQEIRGMRQGDVIAQQAHVPPGPVGLKLLFGVRVLSVYRSANAAGFRYGTLVGHPEMSTNEFAFRVNDDGVVATIRTRATMGLPITRLFGGVAVRCHVAFSNRAALRRMREQFLRRNTSASRDH